MNHSGLMRQIYRLFKKIHKTNEKLRHKQSEKEINSGHKESERFCSFVTPQFSPILKDNGIFRPSIHVNHYKIKY